MTSIKDNAGKRAAQLNEPPWRSNHRSTDAAVTADQLRRML
jgi:hypothetical protein